MPPDRRTVAPGDHQPHAVTIGKRHVGEGEVEGDLTVNAPDADLPLGRAERTAEGSGEPCLATSGLQPTEAPGQPHNHGDNDGDKDPGDAAHPVLVSRNPTADGNLSLLLPDGARKQPARKAYVERPSNVACRLGALFDRSKYLV